METTTLTFYGHRLDVILKDNMVYLDWAELVDFAQVTHVEHIPVLMDDRWVHLSYLMGHLDSIFEHSDTARSSLIKHDLFPFVVKELSAIRKLIQPLIASPSQLETGMFMIDGEAYVLQRNLNRFVHTNWMKDIPVPEDVPRFPVAVIPQSGKEAIITDWLIEMHSLPYILNDFLTRQHERLSTMFAKLDTAGVVKRGE